MLLPPILSSLDHLVCQIERDLGRIVELRGEIKRDRRVGSQHKQLDTLEDALAEGSRLIRRDSDREGY